MERSKSPSETPRSSVPRPYSTSPRNAEDLVSQLEERLRDVHAENQLLGRLLREQQASSSSAQQQLLAYQEASSQEVAQLREQLQEALLDNGRLKSEQQRGAAKLSEYRGALDKWKARQAELEELVLELHESASKQAAALVAAAREREQLIAQLAVGATGAGTDASATAQGTHGLSSSSGAPASTSSGPGGARPHAINQAAGDGGGAAAAAGAAAMPSPSSSDTAAAATTTAAGGIGQSQQFTAAVEARLEAIARLHNQQAAAAAAENRALSDQLRELVGQHARLQLEADTARSATAARLVAAEALSEQRRQRVEALEGEVGQLRRALEGCMAAEALHRQQAADAAGRATKARSEVAAAVQEVHSLLAANAALEDGNAQLAEQLAAAHTAADELRRDHTAVRKQLLQARTTSTAALLATAAAEAQDYVTTARSSSLSGGSSSGSTLKSGLPPGIVRYVQVLQFGLKEAEGRAAALQRASEEGAQAESELRLQAAAAYDKQLACQRALLHQVRRAHSLEGLRLADVRELHSMERQLAAQSQELAQLRERLVASRLLGGSSGAAAGAVAPLPAAGAAQMPRSSASGSGRVHSSDVRLVS